MEFYLHSSILHAVKIIYAPQYAVIFETPYTYNK